MLAGKPGRVLNCILYVMAATQVQQNGWLEARNLIFCKYWRLENYNQGANSVKVISKMLATMPPCLFAKFVESFPSSEYIFPVSPPVTTQSLPGESYLLFK